MKAWPVLLALAGATLALAACGGGQPEGGARPTPTAFVAEGTPYGHPCPTGHMSLRAWVFADITVGGVRRWMFPDRPITFPQGQTITMDFQLADCSTVPMTATYPTSQRYEIVVRDADDREIWRWSRDKVFAQVVAEERFESVAYSEVWDQTGSDGRQVTAGTYTVTASLVGSLKADREGVPVDCWSGGAKGECAPQATAAIEITP